MTSISEVAESTAAMDTASFPAKPLSRPSSKLASAAVLFFLGAALLMSWSAGFIGIRFAVEHTPLFLVMFWRTLVAGLVLLPFALTLGPTLRWNHVLPQILFGALAMSGYMTGFALAISYGVPTGLVALISDMLPLLVALLSWPVLGQVLTARQWLGSAIGLMGVMIASGWSVEMGHAAMWAYGLPILGTMCIAMGTLFQQRSPTNFMLVHQRLCIQCLSASVIFALISWHEGGLVPTLDISFIGGLLWLVIVATFGGYGLYYLALQKSSPAQVTALLYLSPPVTMIWAWVMFGEPLSWVMAMGCIVSLVGITLVSKSQRTQ